MDPKEARIYLSSLLNRNFRVLTTDGRLFRGAFKSIDSDKNIVLTDTFEYRPPAVTGSQGPLEGPEGSVVSDMASRYVGTVVVPGQHIVKMGLEEFASQIREGVSIM